MEPNSDNHNLMNAGPHSQSASQVHAFAGSNSHARGQGHSTQPTGDWSWPRPKASRSQAGQAAAPDNGRNGAGESKLTAWKRQSQNSCDEVYADTNIYIGGIVPAAHGFYGTFSPVTVSAADARRFSSLDIIDSNSNSNSSSHAGLVQPQPPSASAVSCYFQLSRHPSRAI
jgi:hypothetical protein